MLINAYVLALPALVTSNMRARALNAALCSLWRLYFQDNPHCTSYIRAAADVGYCTFASD